MFPELYPPEALRQVIDDFNNYVNDYLSEPLQHFTQPINDVLYALEKFLIAAPWWSIILTVVLIAFVASRRVLFSLGIGIGLFVFGTLGFWDDGMRTIALMIIATSTAIVLGLPLGIMTAKLKWFRTIITPVLDVMQTMPGFVYLIPFVVLFGLSQTATIIVTFIYASPPLIRLTSLGIREVNPDVLEASRAFGANGRQQLFGVELPLALPSIMTGINQTIMMALAMVVVASLIGAQGLGRQVLLGLNHFEYGRAFVAGLCIVFLAIIFDRIIQSYGNRIRQELNSDAKN